MGKGFAISVTAVAAAVIMVVAFLWVGPGAGPLVGSASASLPLYDEDHVVAIYRQVAPAVVQVRVGERGQGSGFLVDAEGHIVTNNHVVASADTARVVLDQGKVVDATVVGRSPAHDLALLKVDADAVNGVQPLELGDSDALKPGQMAIAVGNPYGLDDTVTLGIISGLGRSLPSYLNRPIPDVIQTDAAINPGNSGGPLLNSQGEVVGINTAIETSMPGGNAGIGFAVPVNTLKQVLPRLVEGGTVRPPYLGILARDIDEELAQRLRLPAVSGIYVVEVVPDSPAEGAGLIPAGTDRWGRPAAGGDIITAADGQPVYSVADLVGYLNGKNQGDVVVLTAVRGDETVPVPVTLGSWPVDSTTTPKVVPPGSMPLPEPPGTPFGNGDDSQEDRRWRKFRDWLEQAPWRELLPPQR